MNLSTIPDICSTCPDRDKFVGPRDCTYGEGGYCPYTKPETTQPASNEVQGCGRREDMEIEKALEILQGNNPEEPRNNTLEKFNLLSKKFQETGFLTEMEQDEYLHLACELATPLHPYDFIDQALVVAVQKGKILSPEEENILNNEIVYVPPGSMAEQRNCMPIAVKDGAFQNIDWQCSCSCGNSCAHECCKFMEFGKLACEGCRCNPKAQVSHEGPVQGYQAAAESLGIQVQEGTSQSVFPVEIPATSGSA